MKLGRRVMHVTDWCGEFKSCKCFIVLLVALACADLLSNIQG